MRTRNAITIILAIAMVLTPVTTAGAAGMTTSATAPVTDGADIFMLNTTGAYDIGGDQGHLWSNRAAQGQTFTTGSDAGGYMLNAITLQDRNNAGTSGTFTIRVGTVSGTDFTQIASEIAASVSDYVAWDYFTATLDTPISLLPNTVYGFDFGVDGPGFVTNNNVDTEYAGGSAYSSGAGGIGDATITLHDGVTANDGDRVFHLDMNVTGTPSETLNWDGDIGNWSATGLAVPVTHPLDTHWDSGTVPFFTDNSTGSAVIIDSGHATVAAAGQAAWSVNVGAAGQLSVVGGDLTVAFGLNSASTAALTVGGGGTLTAHGAITGVTIGSGSGTISVSENALSGTDLTIAQDSGLVKSGAGSLNFNGTIAINATGATIELAGGTLGFENAGGVDLSNAALSVSDNSTLSAATAATLEIGTLTVANGNTLTLANSGTATNVAALTAIAAGESAALTAPGAPLNIASTLAIGDGSTFTFSGDTATFTGVALSGTSASIGVSGAVDLGGALPIGPGFTLNIDGTGSVQTTDLQATGTTGSPAIIDFSGGATLAAASFHDGSGAKPAANQLNLTGAGTLLIDTVAGGTVDADGTIFHVGSGATLQARSHPTLWPDGPMGADGTTISLDGGTAAFRRDAGTEVTMTWDFEPLAGQTVGTLTNTDGTHAFVPDGIHTNFNGDGFDRFTDGVPSTPLEYSQTGMNTYAGSGAWYLGSDNARDPDTGAYTYQGNNNPGMMETPVFTLGAGGAIVDFMQGGGNNDYERFQLVKASDDSVLFDSTSTNTWNMVSRQWDATGAEYHDLNVYLRIWDKQTGGWGMTSVDNVTVSAVRDYVYSALEMTDTDFIVTADSSIVASTPLSASFGSLTFAAPAVLTTGGAAGGVSFANSTLSDGSNGFNTESNTAPGPITVGAAVNATIVKTGAADLILDTAGPAIDPSGSLAFDVQGGRLIAQAGSNPLGDGSPIGINGGEVVLVTSAAGSPVTFDNPVTSSGGTLTGGRDGDGLGDPIVTIGNNSGNDVTLTSGTLTMQTFDGYTLNVAGNITGAGHLTIGAASDVTVAGTLDAGTVTIDGSLSVAGTVNVNEFIANTGGTYSGSSVLTVAQTLTLNGGMDLSAAPLVVDGANVTVSGGTLTLQAGNNLGGVTPVASVDVSNAGGLDLAGASLTTQKLSTSGGSFDMGGAGSFIATGNVIAAPASGPGQLELSGDTLTISGSMPAGTIAYYSFDDAGNLGQDLAGAHNGAPGSGASFSTDSQLGSGALNVTNADDGNINVGNADFGAMTNGFTIAAFIKPDSVASGIQRIFGSAPGGASGLGFGLNGDDLRFTSFGVTDYDSGDIAVPAGAWSHIAVAFDESNQAVFYLNGTQVGDMPTGGAAGVSASDFFIGRLGVNPMEPYGGLIDEFYVIERALNGTEISDLYNSVGGGAMNMPGTNLLMTSETILHATSDVTLGALTVDKTIDPTTPTLKFTGAADLRVILASTTFSDTIDPLTVDTTTKVNLGVMNLGATADPVIEKIGAGEWIITDTVGGYTGDATCNISEGTFVLGDPGLIGSAAVNMASGAALKLSSSSGDKTYNETITFTGDPTILAGKADGGSADTAVITVPTLPDMSSQNVTLGATDTGYTLKIDAAASIGTLQTTGPGAVVMDAGLATTTGLNLTEGSLTVNNAAFVTSNDIVVTGTASLTMPDVAGSSAATVLIDTTGSVNFPQNVSVTNTSAKSMLILGDIHASDDAALDISGANLATRTGTLTLSGTAPVISFGPPGPISEGFGVNARGGGGEITGAETAGVISSANWNNINGATGTMADGTVIDYASDILADVDFSWSANGSYTNGASGASGDQDLFHGGLESQNLNYAAANEINVHDIPYSTYDVYMYFTSWDNNANRTGYARINGDGGTEMGFRGFRDYPGGYVLASGTVIQSNYWLIEDVTGADLKLEWKKSNNNVMLAGFELRNKNLPGSNPIDAPNLDVVLGMGGPAATVTLNGSAVTLGSLTTGTIADLALATASTASFNDVHLADAATTINNGGAEIGLAVRGMLQTGATGNLTNNFSVNGDLTLGDMNAVGATVTAKSFTGTGAVNFDGGSGLVLNASTLAVTGGTTTFQSGSAITGGVTDISVSSGASLVVQTAGVSTAALNVEQGAVLNASEPVSVSDQAIIGDNVTASIGGGAPAFDVSGADVISAHTLTLNGGAMTLTGLAEPDIYAATGNVIGVNFRRGNGVTEMLPADIAGVAVAHANWNNSDGGFVGTTANIAGPIAATLVDQDGIATAATIAWAADTNWSNNNGGNGDEKMMTGYLDDTNATPEAAEIKFENIPFATYGVYAYMGSDGNDRTGNVTVTEDHLNVTPSVLDTFHYKTWAQGLVFPDDYVRITETSGDGIRSNYALWEGLTADNFTAANLRESNNSGFQGIQIAEMVFVTPATTYLSNTTIATTANSTATIVGAADVLALGGVDTATGTTLTLDSPATNINLTNLTMNGDSMVRSTQAVDTGDVAVTAATVELSGGMNYLGDAAQLGGDGDSNATTLTLSDGAVIDWTFDGVGANQFDGGMGFLDVKGNITLDGTLSVNVMDGIGTATTAKDLYVMVARGTITGDVGDVTIDKPAGWDWDSFAIEQRSPATWALVLKNATFVTDAQHPGDTDGNGIVDDVDLANFESAFGMGMAEFIIADLGFDPDFDDDGDVDLDDFVTLRQYFGTNFNDAPVIPDLSQTPEPATMSLLALGALAILRRRRRK
jgi:fibronectin-binding autotransporter adhesin